jgi:hypothetical protein
MTRVLLTYANLAERRIATRRALRLTRRGIDVDLATDAAAAMLTERAYDRVLDVHGADPAMPAATPPSDEGMLRIVGARVEPGLASALQTVRPAWIVPTAVALGTLLIATGASLGVPIVLLVVYALVLAAAATQLFGALHHRLTKSNAPPAVPAPLSSRHTGAA